VSRKVIYEVTGDHNLGSNNHKIKEKATEIQQRIGQPVEIEYTPHGAKVVTK
jgi:hypothetical protein